MKNKKFSFNESKYYSRNPLKKYLLKKFTDRIISIIGDIRPKKILDAGCGEGFIAQLLLSRFPDLNYTGIELDENTVRKARRKVNQAKFIQGSVTKLPFNANTFDLVLCLEVLEHLPNPIQGLKELRRVSKKTVLVSVPDEPLFSCLRLLFFQDILRLGKHPEHLNFWNIRTFSEFLKKYFKKIILFKAMPWLIALSDK